MASPPGFPSCNSHGDPPILGDCWYNCTSEDISGEDKKHRLRKVNIFFSFFGLFVLFTGQIILAEYFKVLFCLMGSMKLGHIFFFEPSLGIF